MKRDEWELNYTADVILKATKTKIAFHESRVVVWKKTQDNVKKEIKESGIKIDEGPEIQEMGNSPYSRVSAGVSYPRGPQIRIRDDLNEHLQRTTQKIREHREKTRQYTAWEAILESQGKASFKLNHDDWIFFFGDIPQEKELDEQI
jgi:hypothetical protein